MNKFKCLSYIKNSILIYHRTLYRLTDSNRNLKSDEDVHLLDIAVTSIYKYIDAIYPKDYYNIDKLTIEEYEYCYEYLHNYITNSYHEQVVIENVNIFIQNDNKDLMRESKLKILIGDEEHR